MVGRTNDLEAPSDEAEADLLVRRLAFKVSGLVLLYIL